jgi:N-acetylglutamate synthase-like GNAT family acetyltransferase
MIKIISPSTQEQWNAYYQLRWDILRKPWNQAQGTEKDENEHIAYHFMAIDENNKVLGVCRLQQNTPLQGQIRFMAVSEKAQGKGIGKLLIKSAEKKAKQLRFREIILQARENAVAFYLNNGYTLVEKTFLLYNSIQHFLMTKQLS